MASEAQSVVASALPTPKCANLMRSPHRIPASAMLAPRERSRFPVTSKMVMPITMKDSIDMLTRMLR